MPRAHAKIIKQTSPAHIWQMAAEAGRQYLLVGDGNHADPVIKYELVKALPQLRVNGFRHLGLEQDRRERQPLVDAFQFASKQQRVSGADKAGLVDFISQAATSYSLANTKVMLADRLVELKLITDSRALGVRLHCINNLLSFPEFLVAAGEPQVKKFARFGEYAFRHLTHPPRISHDNFARLDHLIGQYMDYNLECDAFRAKDFMTLAGKSRAALLFGARHFGRHDSTSIEAHLPPASTAFVYLASAQRVAERMAEAKGPEALKLPDFAIETDTGRGLILLSARTSGLV